MSVVRFTSAQLAEQAFAAAHRCAGDSAASSSSSSSRSSSWVGESGKDGPEPSLGSLSVHEERGDDDEVDEWADSGSDDDDGEGELVVERFLDPDSPLGRAIEIIGRARNLSSVPAQFVHRLDQDWLARADGFAEHCCNGLWTLEALRGADCLGTFSTHLSDGTLDYYHGFHGERAEDAVPYHTLHTGIQQHEGSSPEEATAVPAAAAEEVPTPTPRPGPPRLGRPTSSARANQFFETSAALLTQMRAPHSALPARMPTPRRRPPPVSVSTPAATDDHDSRSPASMPESARQELYELYQYTSNGSRARHASSGSGGGGGGGGDRATETDSLASGLQQIDLDPLRLVDITGPSPGEDEENEAARELWHEEAEIVEGEEEEDELQDMLEQFQRCDDLEAEAAERERDLSEQARRQRSGGPVGR